MAITALLLLVIAKGWQWWANMPLFNWSLSAGALLLGSLLGVGISCLSLLLYYAWPAYRTSAKTYLSLVLQPLQWLDLLWLGLLPGLSEELLFRGIMLPSFGNNGWAVVLSGMSFGVLHMSGRSQWPYAVWATVVGCGFGAIALLTGNLLVPVVAHIVANIFSAVLWKILQARQQEV